MKTPLYPVKLTVKVCTMDYAEKEKKVLAGNLMKPEVASLLTEVRNILAGQGVKAFVVGGLVRDLLLGRDTVDIDIAVPHFGEPDHYLGNLMLLKLVSDKSQKARARIVNHSYQIILLQNNKAEFNKCVGDTASVVPYEKRIELSCTGTEYEVKHLKISPGDSRALRNLITAQNAVFHVKGTAFLIHRYHR